MSGSARPYLPVLDVARILAVLGVIGVHVLADPVPEGHAGTGWLVVRRWTGAGPLSLEEMGRRVITDETFTHL